ncbi:DUF4411 family protein [Mesorhizobium sp. M0400]|uniref:DUF4411 family protein n=1 Tax=Mesorhizobium sp. M0400 TaxID=2956941 RepID=UPI003338314F
MDRSPKYSIDSSSLMHGWCRVYRPKNFGFIWDRIEALAIEGRLSASIEVLHEISKKDDELFKWCKARQEALFVEVDDACQVHLARIMAGYPRLVDTVKGRSGGDPFVIALASARGESCSVVTEEHPGRMRIPDVCRAEGIACMGFADLIEQEDWRFA